jgi:hypothetical protein
MMPEITKLNLLNHFLGVDALPIPDKILLIYEKVLEEVYLSSLIVIVE